MTLKGSSSRIDITQLVTGQRHTRSKAGVESAASSACENSPLSGKEGYSDEEDESGQEKVNGHLI